MTDRARPKPFRKAGASRAAEAPVFRRVSLGAVRAAEAEPRCEVCGEELPPEDGAVDGSLAWQRGDRVDVERVRQCEACAAGLAFTMFRRFEDEDDGG